MKRLFPVTLCCMALFFIGTFLWDANIPWLLSAPEASENSVFLSLGEPNVSNSTSGGGLFVNNTIGSSIFCESFYKEEAGLIFYSFKNEGKQPVWIKSKIITDLTGARWKIPPGKHIFLGVAAPRGVKTEHEKIIFLGEEKLWRFSVYLAHSGGSMSWYVPVDFK